MFVGGSYSEGRRKILDLIKASVKGCGFHPILADEFKLRSPDRDVHDVTLWLLHSCRLAIFDLSTRSGAWMEVERMRDYGIFKALLLYNDASGRDWLMHPDVWNTTQMVKSLALEHESQYLVKPYIRPIDAAGEAGKFLRAIKRSSYGEIHGLR